MAIQNESPLSNRSRVLEIIRNNDDIFKAEIARITGLSIPTIMRITDEFIENGLVVVTGKRVFGGGKPPATLRVNPECRYFAGVDLGDSTITCVVLDLKGRTIIKDSISAVQQVENGDIVALAIDLAERTLNTASIDMASLYGIGIGVPGIVDPDTGVVSSQSLGLTNFDIGKAFSQHFSIDSFVDNTAKVTARAEQWYGSGRNRDSFIMLAFGRGIGSAMVVNGEMYRGMHNMSGEVGHTVVDINGPLCRCGKRGCLETLASNKAIERQARQMMQDRFESSMWEMAGGSPEAITAQIVMAAAENGDRIAGMIADKAFEYIAVAIENLVSIFDINYLILSGRIIKKSPWFLAQLKKRLRKSKAQMQGRDVELVLAELGNEAAAVGAATLPLAGFIRSLD